MGRSYMLFTDDGTSIIDTDYSDPVEGFEAVLRCFRDSESNIIGIILLPGGDATGIKACDRQ